MIAPLLLSLSQAMAPMPSATPCSSAAAPLPAPLAGFAHQQPLQAGTGADAPSLPVGIGVLATLRPAATLHLPVPTSRPAPAGSSGGVFAVRIATAGRYRIALGEGAWIDLTRDGQMLASVAHGHGPACSPVHKMVDFDLQPGRYLVQLSEARGPTLALMIAKLP